MSPGSHDRGPDLTLVAGAAPLSASDSRTGPSRPAARELDWSIYMARAQGGDREAYRRLLEDVTPYLRSIAARHFQNSGDIEDTVQEVLLTVHAVRHTYDPARPFGPWLVAIANRRVVDGLRRQGRSRAREVALETGHETFAAPQANLAEAASDGRVLRDAVEQLPPGQRDAIRMLKLQEMSLKEAAAVSGMTVAALKVATHRALKSLRKVLGRQDRRT
ncbi:MAG TPA: sigma-70 family RNA polymerase sigma factor [Burkholderiales bacterium]|nr:sigma-70 family RNA polymerase sigma factor [Burkholderiales bacterium]